MMTSYPTFRLVLAGRVNDENFQKCLQCVKFLEQNHPSTVSAVVLPFFETQWEEYLKKVQNEKKGPFFQHKLSPLIYCNDYLYIGDSEQFMEWVLGEFRYVDNSSMIIYKKKATDQMKLLIDKTPGRSYIYMDINISGAVSKVIIELFTEYSPKTCENFKKLCEGGFMNKDGKQLSYVGTEFHRVVKGMYIQGGDMNKNGIKENASIYDGEFADESFHIKHTEIGLVGMAKKKGYSHTNESQFYITTSAPLSFLDSKYVIFGRVVQGMRTIKVIDKLETVNEKPISIAKIQEAGVYSMNKKELVIKKKK